MAEQDKYKTKANPLEQMLEKKVQITTTDGQIFCGTLKGIDQALNAILSDCEERIFSADNGVQKIKMGLYMMRGDSVAILGEINEEIESMLDFSNMKAAPLNKIIN